jgi:zinc D-Ala-D-Ala dipeptidase
MPRCAGAHGGALALALALGVAPAAIAQTPPGFARLAQIAPQIAQDMRYAGANNFTGKPVPGYKAAQCWLRADAARALARAQRFATAQGFSLIVYDCYRPTRAVRAFADWSHDPDETTKPAYYPNVEKRALFAEGYIALQSTHSTGLAVDIGASGKDFGAPFDFFDKTSWTASAVSPEARRNRDRLVAVMRRAGFTNYPREWWHFTFKGAERAKVYDAEIE